MFKSEISLYAQAAIAAYATDLNPGDGNAEQYEQPDLMSRSQAEEFNAKWAVVEQHPDATTGFSAVLLQNRQTGQKTLAIAGTDRQSGEDLVTDIIDIVIFGSVVAMPQYGALDGFHQRLMASGKIAVREQIVVTGHSLGGFLAQAFVGRNPGAVSAAFTYNAPGFGTIESALAFLGLTSAAAGQKITNIHATDGLHFVAGIGTLLGSSVSVRIEPDSSLLGNHSILRLSDALAVDAAYAKLLPAATLEQIEGFIRVAGKGDLRLESALDALRTVFVGSYSNDISKTPTGDRDRFYANLTALQNDEGFRR